MNLAALNLAALDLVALDLVALDLAALDLGDLAYRLLGATSPVVYRLCGGLVLALLLACTLAPLLRPGRLRGLLAHPLAFALTVFATLLAYRWPSFASEEMSHDESLHVTIGLALAQDPLPWRGVDGASAGCLVHYPLALANVLGLEANYATARFLGLGMITLTLLLLWRAVAAFTNHSALARLVVLPATAACALAESVDYLAYNSEQPLNLLLAGALFALLRAWSASSERRWRWLLALGLCLGAIPLTKLQGAPSGVVLALAGYALLWLREPAGPARVRQAALLTLGGLLPLLITLGVLASVDLVEFFLRSTFVDGANYSQVMTGRSVGRRIRDLGSFVFLDSGAKDLGVFNRALILPALLLGGALLTKRIRQSWTPRTVWLVVTSLAFLGATLFGILFPGTRFPHYLLLTLPALTLCWGLVLALALTSRRRGLVLALGLLLALNVIGLRPVTAPLRQTEPRFAGPSHVASVLEPYLEDQDWLATWGLDLRYCVQTRHPFHARMPFPFRFAPHVKQRSYWLENYMARWRETNPPCLVAAGSALWRLEYVQPVREHVAQNYRLVDAFVDRVERRPVRVFVSRARLEQLLGPGSPLPRPGAPWVPPCARELGTPRREHRTLVDFSAPLPDGQDLRAGTDLAWGLTRPGTPSRLRVTLPAGARRLSFLARTVADDDPSLAKERPALVGELRFELREGAQSAAEASATIGPSTRPGVVTLTLPGEGDSERAYVLELSSRLPRPGAIAVSLLRWN